MCQNENLSKKVYNLLKGERLKIKKMSSKLILQFPLTSSKQMITTCIPPPPPALLLFYYYFFNLKNDLVVKNHATDELMF